jgi:hypothetical protein
MRSLTAFCILASFIVSGCVVIRTTEQRITLNKDGSGSALLRLIDIRSDAKSDSAVQRDFEELISAFDSSAVAEFEAKGRRVTARQFILHGDTLIAEVAYTFTSLDAVEGLRLVRDDLYVVIAPEREVVRTNGKVRDWVHGGKRIVWDRDASRLLFQIREKTLPPSVSLARLYRDRYR